MNRKYLALIAMIIALVAFTGCSDDSDEDGDPVTLTGYDFTTILAGYSGNVVVPTYAAMDANGAVLLAAVAALAEEPTQANIDAACEAWVATRAPWERSEAFLFGPAAFRSLDPSLDTWPLDHQQLQDVMNSDFELTADFVAEGLGPALRGFHTVEFLLFSEGEARDIATVGERELEYLVAATTVLAGDAHLLHVSWTGGTIDDEAISSYKAEFDGAGSSGSRYNTQVQAAQEIIEGMIAICDEVANGKIADPYDEQDTSLVESQFSFNSLVDFHNNLVSVENAYLGVYNNMPENPVGITDYVAEMDADLDARVKSELTAAKAAIQNIPEPFRNNLNANTQIEAAQTAINTLITTLNDVIDVLLND